MGACAAKMKEMGAGIDHKAIEMNVKGKRVDIAQKTKLIAEGWAAQLERGESVRVSPAEVLPVSDPASKNIQLDFTSGPNTDHKQLLKTALYCASNTVCRNQLKKETWVDLEAGMRARKLPDAVIKHGQAGVNPAIDAALDKQIEAMVASIEKGEPLISEAEMKSVGDYQALKQKEHLAAGGAQAPVPAPLPADQKPIDSKDIVLQEENQKDRDMQMQGQGLEKDSGINRQQNLRPMQAV